MAGEVISLAMSLRQIMQEVAIPIGRNVAQRLPPASREKIMRILDFLQSDAQRAASAMASIQESRIRNAYLKITLAMTEIRMCCRQWNAGHQPLAITAGSPPPWDTLKKCQDYKKANRHFQEAETEAMTILHDSKNVRSYIRVEAMNILLSCQIVLHWEQPDSWFNLWLAMFENSFFEDRDLVKSTLFKSRFREMLSPDDKVARIRMEQLIGDFSNAIANMFLDSDPTVKKELAIKAQVFVKNFNHSTTGLADLKGANDWILLGPSEGSPSGIIWFACSWGKLGLFLSPDPGVSAHRPFGGKFISLNDCKDPIAVAPTGLVYGVSSKGELVQWKIDPKSQRRVRRNVIEKGAWKILGYASDQGKILACNGANLTWIPGGGNSCTDLPLDGQPIDFVILVAANGSLMAYNKTTKQRFVKFASGCHGKTWLEIDDSKNTEPFTTVSQENQLIVDGSGDSHRLVRLSLASCGGRNMQIQAEKIKATIGGTLPVLAGGIPVIAVSKFNFFDIDTGLYGGALTTNFSRVPLPMAKPGWVYLAGYTNGSTAMRFSKIRLTPDRGRITKRAKFEVECECETEMYPRIEMGRISYENGVIYV